MDPKVEIVKLNIQKKGHVRATFTAKVTFDEKYTAHFPGMKVIEGAKGTFTDVPQRKFKEEGFVPQYYLNKELKDLITEQALYQFNQFEEDKKRDQNT